MIESLFSGIDLAGVGIMFVYALIASLGVPGALVLMVSSGALANNFTGLAFIMLAAALGAIFGDITAYELARRFSLALSAKLKGFKFFADNEQKARKQLKKYEFSFVFFTRFALMSLCAPVSYISGFERLNRKKFLVAVISGEVLYALIYPLIGFIF